MKVDILASGSGGNCIALRSGETTILVDVGIAKTKIEKRLLEVGIRADEINAIFLTHAHKDHTKGLPIANKYRIPVYTSEEEWKDIDGVDKELINVVHNFYEGWTETNLYITPFRTHHDAFESVGYAIEDLDTRKKISICLDTGIVDSDMLEVMKDSDIYIIESNHDPSMVETSKYPDSVKARILSDIGHLSNEQTANALSKLVRGKGEQIYLTHLSKSNNLPVLAEMTVKRALAKKGFKPGKHYEIEVI